VIAVPTGRILNQGTRSETAETVYWDCLSPEEASTVPPTGGTPATSAFPTTTLLVVGGLAAVGLVAFLVLR
jgi:hypothetical protein